MGYMGFGMQKWIYQRKPKRFKERKGPQANAMDYGRSVKGSGAENKVATDLEKANRGPWKPTVKIVRWQPKLILLLVLLLVITPVVILFMTWAFPHLF